MNSIWCPLNFTDDSESVLFHLCDLKFPVPGSTYTGVLFQKRLVQGFGIQCGFCSPGMIMSCYTLLRNKPKPTAEDIEFVLEGMYVLYICIGSGRHYNRNSNLDTSTDPVGGCVWIRTRKSREEFRKSFL